MNKEQTQALRCAFADLIGSLHNTIEHDWKAHAESIEDLIRAFPELHLDLMKVRAFSELGLEDAEGGQDDGQE